MPWNTSRSGCRLRPGCRVRRSTLGNSGSITAHNSSSTSHGFGRPRTPSCGGRTRSSGRPRLSSRPSSSGRRSARSVYRRAPAGVRGQPICRVLTGHGLKIATSTYYAARKRAPSARSVRDAELKTQISRVHADNFSVYGVRKVWRQLHREGIPVARCTVARLMRDLGLQGVRRGRGIRTTVRDDGHDRADDLLQRDFTASRPNERWVADFTYVASWSGIVYVAFVVDVFSRAIVGWSAATSKRAKLVLDALDMALWRRDRAGDPAGPGLIHHSDAGSQYTSFAFTAHLLEAGIDASIGTVGDALDNALMESQIGLYKTELIKPRKPWHGLPDVELATAEWVDWFNNQRLHTAIGSIPPHEHETNYYAQHQPQPAAGANA
ncbi:IS3 family transposase [Streptomyces drozdowiczii]